MINFLKKSKLNLISTKKPNSYIIAQLLPVKQKAFIEFVRFMKKFDLEVKFVKSKNYSGVLRSFFHLIYNNYHKNVYSTSIIIIFDKKKEKQNNLFIKYFEAIKKNPKLSIINKIILLSFFSKGILYNTYQIRDKFELDNNFFYNLNFNIIKLISTINLITFKILLLCKQNNLS